MDKKELKNLLKIDEKKQEIKSLEKEMADPDFWSDHRKAKQKSKKLAKLQKIVDKFNKAQKSKEIEELKKEALLEGRFANSNAIITISPGTGGVDAQDWAEILMRMYLRFAKNEGWQARVVDKKSGKEAGIKEATLHIKGPKAYGWLKAEDGVHRLVRKSPFNAQNLRQTSFALVDVVPETEEVEVELKEEDLSVETFRSSGPGGQSVNTTDSAVRITHKPTDITVSVQNEKSQAQNKRTALKILKGKILKAKEEEKQKEVSKAKGKQASADWGNQIRSYVFDPYQQVKDHRTDEEVSDVEGVLDGEKLKPLIEGYLKKQEID